MVAPLDAPLFLREAATGTTPQEHSGMGIPNSVDFITEPKVALPSAIAGAAFLSKQITQPLVTEAQQGFEGLQEELTPHALNERFFPDSQGDDSLWSYLDLRAKLQDSREAIIKMAEYLREVTEEFAVWTIKIIAGYLFDCIIFPLAFFIVGYILTKNLLAYVIGIRRDHTMRKDLEIILDKYYGK